MSDASAPALAGATAQLVAFACDRRVRGTSTTRASLRDLIVDTVGVTAAGLATPAGATLRAWVEGQSVTGSSSQFSAEQLADAGAATLLGGNAWLSPADAALINGTAAHALDWDDAAPSMAMHPAAVLLPTIFALAARRPVTGSEIEEAYNVGSAVFRAVSEALPHGVHYGRGWHNTSTTGRLAATAAGVRLLGLDEAQAAHAFGIAATTAAGSLANFGTMTKPMHAGLTARDAVMALGLAQLDFTANPAQLESRGGFFDLFGDHDPARTALLTERLDFWATEWVNDYAIKAYPSCFATQRAIDGGFALRAELAGDLSTIEQIEVTLEAGGLRPLRDAPPSTGLEAKFSLEYTTAVSLLFGDVLLSDFTDEALLRPGIAELMAKVVIAERPAADEPGHTIVTVKLADGRTLVQDIHHSRGDSHRPLTRDELGGKFAQCAGDGAAVQGWFDALHAVADSTEPSTLQTLLAGPSA